MSLSNVKTEKKVFKLIEKQLHHVNVEDEEEYINKLPIRKIDTSDGVEFYDLIVIGGGSAGIACALEAKKLGLQVAIVNYVEPSPLGSKWGWGGTCLNVGCIPKYMFHEAADQVRSFGLRKCFGLENEKSSKKILSISWDKMSKSVQNYIKSESYSLQTLLRTQKIKNNNNVAKFVDANTVGLYKKWDSPDMFSAIKASFFLIATGERPVHKMAEYSGLESCVTTDDFFKITTMPRKVLVLGGGYIALEIASILCGFNVDTTLYHRSNLVKGKV